MTRHALLYTEMVTTGAVLHGDRARLIGFDPFEHPRRAAARRLAIRARWRNARASAQELGYDEINLNVGCPSDRVQEGRFGACLMAEPGAGRRLRGRHEGAGARAGHGQMPHRHRRAGSRGGARDLRRRGRARGRRRAGRACPQGLAQGPVAAPEPRRAAARLRPRASAQGRASRSARWCSTAASRASPRRPRISLGSTA